MSAPILPGATLGVLGGGQLGRMFALAARRLGYRVAIYVPEEDSPAGQVADRSVRAAYDDLEAVERFAREVDVVTFEFENVPAATAEAAARHAPVRPAGSVLHAAQDRAREKRALADLGLAVAPWADFSDAAGLETALARVGAPAILKSNSWGYDGKGQVRVARARDLAAAWRSIGEVPAVLEGLVRFESELAVVGARGLDGAVALYEPTLNEHVDHILDVSLSPAPVPASVADEARAMARAVLEGLDVVGVLCVELFLDADGTLRVNEIAPRPHNSGHVTIDAHVCCQFENQVRAVCGLPLGSTGRRVPAAAMVNLLGDLWRGGEPDWAATLADPEVRLHLYGKARAKPGRKMGHLSVAEADVGRARARALAARAALTART
ncbi:MAG TPA: 5-(carboxyamino)imidazole ribonucleotide synthase [Planctomycetota bacterium]|nr:5-(carboxyamino)imidazole ribonucleotide synthase [Planctomycetota bacterium]